MTNFFRIIPKFEIKEENLVKGIQLEGLRVLGKCHDFAKLYYEDQADEIFYQDVVSTLYGQDNLLNLISKTASNIFIPLTVGGGIRTVDNIKKILLSGADRVSLNSSLFSNLNFLKEAVNVFGSSTIVGSIEAVKNEDGFYYAHYENGRTLSKFKVIDWIDVLQSSGIGEIFLTFVDCDGLGINCDIDFLKQLNGKIKVPLIVQGGIGNMDHILEISKIEYIDGISCASLFHYNYLHKVKDKDLDNYTQGNLKFLKSKRDNNFYGKINNILELKKKLNLLGVNCRI